MGTTENKQKRKKKKGVTPGDLLIILVVIAIIAAVVYFVFFNKKEGSKHQTPSQTEEFVSVMEDGTKQNTSSKLATPKKLGGLEVTNIRLTERDGLTLLLADVRNVGTEKDGDYAVTIKMVDKEGKELITATGYIDTVKPAETVTLNTSITANLANAYDFAIEKAK